MAAEASAFAFAFFNSSQPGGKVMKNDVSFP